MNGGGTFRNAYNQSMKYCGKLKLKFGLVTNVGRIYTHTHIHM